MNEKIKAFAEQAGYSSWELNPTKETMSEIDHAARLTAFAELIVKECCSMVNAHVQQTWNPNDCLLVLDIKEHFSMEKTK